MWTCSLRQATREYGVPLTTLKRRIDSSLSADAKPGPSTVLLKKEEDKLANYKGFGLTPLDIRGLAYEFSNGPSTVLLKEEDKVAKL